MKTILCSLIFALSALAQEPEPITIPLDKTSWDALQAARNRTGPPVLFAQAQAAQPPAPQPRHAGPPAAPQAKPAPRRPIINSLADVPAQQAGSITIELDANSMTALEAQRTQAGLPDILTLVQQIVGRAVQDAMRRYPPAEIYAAQQTLIQRFQQHMSQAQVKVTVGPATSATPVIPVTPAIAK